MKRIILLLISLTFASLTFSAQTPSPQNFSPAQEQAIKNIVHQYLLENPEILIEVSKKLKEMQQAQLEEKTRMAIKQNFKATFDDNHSPVTGNPKGTVSLIEFYDYQCMYCRMISPVINNLVQANANLRVIFKPVSFIGKSSEFAAKAILASNQQGKMLAFHDALFNAKSRLTPFSIMQIAGQVGLNTKTLRQTMQNKNIEQQLEKNMELAKRLHVIATPALVIAKYIPGQTTPANVKSYFVLGASSQSDLQDLINKANQ